MCRETECMRAEGQQKRECVCVCVGGGSKNRWTDMQTHMYIDWKGRRGTIDWKGRRGTWRIPMVQNGRQCYMSYNCRNLCWTFTNTIHSWDSNTDVIVFSRIWALRLTSWQMMTRRLRVMTTEMTSRGNYNRPLSLFSRLNTVGEWIYSRVSLFSRVNTVGLDLQLCIPFQQGEHSRSMDLQWCIPFQ